MWHCGDAGVTGILAGGLQNLGTRTWIVGITVLEVFFKGTSVERNGNNHESDPPSISERAVAVYRTESTLHQHGASVNRTHVGRAVQFHAMCDS